MTPRFSALSKFLDAIHSWYPILAPDYSTRYVEVLYDIPSPSAAACLALIVAALGSFSSGSEEPQVDTYGRMALDMVSCVITQSSITAVQALVYIAVYYCCLCRPLEAFEFISIASFKAQNLLQRNQSLMHDQDHELLGRAYWAILLIEK